MASEDSYDVVVAGGGPAGSTTAAFLARQGRRVALLDKAKFPRDKPCGDAISGKSVRVLDALGLIDAVEAEPKAQALGVRFTAPDQTELVIPFPKPKASQRRQAAGGGTHNEPGYVCRREVYDNVLFQAARREGVDVFEQTEVVDVVRDNGTVAGVTTKDGHTFRAGAVVGAGGALCPVGRAVGSYDRDTKHWVAAIRVYWKDVADVDENIEIHFVDDVIPGYFWIFPLEDGWANVGIGMREDFIQRDDKNLRTLLDQCIEEHPLFKDRFAGATKVEGSQRGWILPMGSKRRTIHGDGWVTVGDAAGLIDPFSGEGIGNGMVSGQIAADVVGAALDAGDVAAERLAPYPERLWAEVGDELKRSYTMQKLGRRKWLLNFVVKKAARSPELQARLSEMLSDREDTSELTSFWFYLRLLFR